jgi:hypothetical protein
MLLEVLYAQLIADVHTMLNEFPFHKVQYLSRDASKVVHGLAKQIVNRSCDFMWIDEFNVLHQSNTM